MEMWSEERKRGSGQALVAGSVVRGEKLRVWVKRWWREVWSVGRNYGLGSNLGGGKCGPGSQTAALGQARPHPSVVRGEKLWSWVKPWWREMWSREQNRALGQTLPRLSVVQGEKLWSWVKPWWREMWSVGRNRGFGSSTSPPECGPGREIMVLGQTLVAGNVVRGSKTVPWVKLCPARVWSRGRNYGLGSNLGGEKCGPGRETAAPGQARPRPSVVQGAKLRPRVKPAPARVWSRERNCGPGSNSAPPECGLGSKTVPRVKPAPAAAWSRGRNCGPGSSPPPPECGPGSQTAAPSQARPRPSVVQGEKPCPGSNPPPPKCGPGSKTVALGQTLPRPSVVRGAKLRPQVKPVPARVWSREQNRAPRSSRPQVNPIPPCT